MARRVALIMVAFALACGIAQPVSAVVADGYEPSDGSPATARDITALVPWPGAAPRVERHTIGAQAAVGPADEDWFRLTVSPAEAPASTFSIEARSLAAGLDPVIEVFAEDTTPTAYASLPAGDGGRTGFDPLAVAGADGAAWLAAGSASLDFLPPAAGTYLVRVRPYYDAGFDGFADGFSTRWGTYELRVKRGHATRIAGADRLATAIAASRERFPDRSLAGGAAVVANGYGFADALAGSTLAGAVGGPLLLTRPDRLTDAVRAEIARLGVKRVYVLGGAAAVSSGVARSIDRISGVAVTRVAGRDRYATAAAVARKADAVHAGGSARVAFLASGTKFPDALSASPMAASAVAPILLTRPDGLSSAAKAALRDPALGITDVVIVGGSPAVSGGVATAVKSIVGAGHVRRISGPDRYRTSAAFAAWATNGGSGTGNVGTSANPSALPALAFSRMGLALGSDFPDALAGGVSCGLAGAPLLLTPRTQFSPWIFAGLNPFDSVGMSQDYYHLGGEALLRSYAYGGTKALSADVLRDLDWLTGRHLSTY